MTRKHTRRRVIVPLPPKGLRPKLQPDQVSDLALVHNANLDAVAKGTADETTLWHLVEAALTWSKVAELIEAGEPEMRVQLELASTLVERYGRTGRVLFTGTEYQVAKEGVQVMDQLAEMTDKPSAVIAAEWSERKRDELQAACAARERKAA